MKRQNCKNCGEPYTFNDKTTPGQATRICPACQKRIYVHTGQIHFDATSLSSKKKVNDKTLKKDDCLQSQITNTKKLTSVVLREGEKRVLSGKKNVLQGASVISQKNEGSIHGGRCYVCVFCILAFVWGLVSLYQTSVVIYELAERKIVTCGWLELGMMWSLTFILTGLTHLFYRHE